MVPTAIVVMKRLPLTANGKVDRRALPAPDISEVKKSLIVPQTGLERQLQEIWQEVLGLKHVGLEDNFFDIGGHSLLAVRLFAQMEKHLGKKLSLSLVFLAPTIKGL